MKSRLNYGDGGHDRAYGYERPHGGNGDGDGFSLSGRVHGGGYGDGSGNGGGDGDNADYKYKNNCYDPITPSPTPLALFIHPLTSPDLRTTVMLFVLDKLIWRTA